MSGEGNPSGGGGRMTAAQMLLALTGAASLANGGLLYGDGDATLATLAPGTNGHVLTLAGGVPTWAANPASALPGSYAVGDILYASGASTLAKLAAVATGSVLASAGVTTAPAWSSSIALTGTVASKQSAAAGISLDHNSATGNFTHRLSPNNLTANRRTTFGDADFSFTGGGTLALGGFTLTIPATGTAALLTTANAFTAAQTIQAPNGLTVTAAATQDAIRITGRAGGTSSYIGTFVPDILSASRTWTMPNVTGVVMTRTSTALVATRMVLSDANGQLVDVAVSTTASLTAGGLTFANASGAAALVVQGTTGTERYLSFTTAGSTRWVMKATADAESGSDAGSNFRITMHNDAGAATENVLTILRPALGLTTLSRPLLLQVGTITSAIQALESTVTWNSGGTTFTGWKLNVTDTASATASLLLDMQIGGSSKAKIAKNGAFTLTGNTETASAPILNLTQGWNNSGVAFTLISADLTITATSSLSKFIDFAWGGISRFTVGYLGLITHSSSVLMATNVALGNGAGVAAGTLSNAPAAGNPTKWVPINDNGTTRYIPAW